MSESTVQMFPELWQLRARNAAPVPAPDHLLSGEPPPRTQNGAKQDITNLEVIPLNSGNYRLQNRRSRYYRPFVSGFKEEKEKKKRKTRKT